MQKCALEDCVWLRAVFPRNPAGPAAEVARASVHKKGVLSRLPLKLTQPTLFSARTPIRGSFTVPTSTKAWDAFPGTEKSHRDSWISVSLVRSQHFMALQRHP